MTILLFQWNFYFVIIIHFKQKNIIMKTDIATNLILDIEKGSQYLTHNKVALNFESTLSKKFKKYTVDSESLFMTELTRKRRLTSEIECLKDNFLKIYINVYNSEKKNNNDKTTLIKTWGGLLLLRLLESYPDYIETYDELYDFLF